MINKNGMLHLWLMIPFVFLTFIAISIHDANIDDQFETLELHDQYLLQQVKVIKDDVKILDSEINTIYIDLSLLDQQNDTQINQIKRRIKDLKFLIQNIDSVEAMSNIEELWRKLNMIRKVIGE